MSVYSDKRGSPFFLWERIDNCRLDPLIFILDEFKIEVESFYNELNNFIKTTDFKLKHEEAFDLAYGKGELEGLLADLAEIDKMIELARSDAPEDWLELERKLKMVRKKMPILRTRFNNLKTEVSKRTWDPK